MRTFNIFFDETGDNGLDFSKQNTRIYYTIAAIVVLQENLPLINAGLDKISRTKFGGGLIRSKNVADNHQRRRAILKELIKLDWTGYVLAVNKSLLLSPGYSFVQSFYKHINNKIYSYMLKAFPNSLLLADQHGSQEFMNSFIKYVVERNDLDLFNPTPFSFGTAKSERCIQLADFISGSISKQFEIHEDFYSAIKERVIIDEWPINHIDFESIPEFQNSEIDRIIAQNAVVSAQKFIEQNENKTDDLIIDQCNVLKLLLFYYINISRSCYVSSMDVRKYLSKLRGLSATLSNYYVGSKVIGKLRSDRVLISSNIRGGYKIPNGLHDIYDYLNNINIKIVPMLDRVSAYQKHIKLITGGTDILEDEKFKFLRHHDLD